MLCRIATVEASTKLVCLTLKRETFTEILGPLEQLMKREKSPQVREVLIVRSGRSSLSGQGGPH
jgi:cGMP-dependent protein kinase 2